MSKIANSTTEVPVDERPEQGSEVPAGQSPKQTGERQQLYSQHGYPSQQQVYDQTSSNAQLDQQPERRPASSDRTNTLAVVAFVLSFVGGLAGIITGHIALSQIKRTGERGRGLAIAGLVIGYVTLACAAVISIVIVVAIAMLGAVESTTSGASNRQPEGSHAPVATESTILNSYGGVTFGKGGSVVPPDAVGTVDIPKPPKEVVPPFDLDDIGIAPSSGSEPVKVVLYTDFLAPSAGLFEEENGTILSDLNDQGMITVEYRPVGFLDRFSQDTKYSSRAATAAACVADSSPRSYRDYLNSLFENQPMEGSLGLDNDVLVKMASDSGAADISGCLGSESFQEYVRHATDLAAAHGVSGVPAVFVDGVHWQDGLFLDFVIASVNAKP